MSHGCENRKVDGQFSPETTSTPSLYQITLNQITVRGDDLIADNILQLGLPPKF
ncbi:hypothetical protein N9B24_02720 [bacterium]|nr:hypothetical protein [bacterium]